MELDPTAGATGTWATYATSQVSIEASAFIDTKRNRFIVLGGAYFGPAGSQFLVFDLNNPNNAPTRPATSGDAGGIALESAQGVGCLYDPIGDRYIAWNGGVTVYVLNPVTWTWSSFPIDSGNTVTPTAAEPTGTYGRMRYVPSKQAFIVVNQTNENVYFFKLTAGSVATVSLSASPTTVSLRQRCVTWRA